MLSFILFYLFGEILFLIWFFIITNPRESKPARLRRIGYAYILNELAPVWDIEVEVKRIN